MKVNRSSGKGRHVMITPPYCLSFKRHDSRHKSCTTNTGKQERRWTTLLQPFVSPDNAGTRGSSCLCIFRSSFAGTPFPSCPSLWCGSSSRKHISTTLSPVLFRERSRRPEHRDVLRLHSVHSPIDFGLVGSRQRSRIHRW